MSGPGSFRRSFDGQAYWQCTLIPYSPQELSVGRLGLQILASFRSRAGVSAPLCAVISLGRDRLAPGRLRRLQYRVPPYLVHAGGVRRFAAFGSFRIPGSGAVTLCRWIPQMGVAWLQGEQTAVCDTGGTVSLLREARCRGDQGDDLRHESIIHVFFYLSSIN